MAAADLAILTLGACTVPVYSTLTAAQARYILQDAGARVAFVSTAEQLEKLQRVRHELPSLEAIVSFEPLDAAVAVGAAARRRSRARPRAADGGVGHRPRRFATRARDPPGQLATIIYTSGTTGEPKG
jgi:long-chain acyl-CoA synthetase